ncbi:MAG: hypothetical protein ACYS80_17730 [Planctomycetota bacterium]
MGIIVRAASPDRILIELDDFCGRTAVHHSGQLAIANGQGLIGRSIGLVGSLTVIKQHQRSGIRTCDLRKN